MKNVAAEKHSKYISWSEDDEDPKTSGQAGLLCESLQSCFLDVSSSEPSKKCF